MLAAYCRNAILHIGSVNPDGFEFVESIDSCVMTDLLGKRSWIEAHHYCSEKGGILINLPTSADNEAIKAWLTTKQCK